MTDSKKLVNPVSVFCDFADKIDKKLRSCQFCQLSMSYLSAIHAYMSAVHVLHFSVFLRMDKFTGHGSSFRAVTIRNPQGMSGCSRPQSGTRGACRGFAAAIRIPRSMSGVRGCNQNPTGHVRLFAATIREPRAGRRPALIMGDSSRRLHMGLSSCGKLC